jgi:hypothetical protein
VTTGTGFEIVALVDEFFVESAWLVATIWICWWTGTVAGGVYRPVEVIVP